MEIVLISEQADAESDRWLTPTAFRLKQQMGHHYGKGDRT